MSESLTQRRILTYLELRGDVFAYRNNTGAYTIGDRYIEYGYPGSADIIGVWRGRFIAIEVKSKTGTQSVKQKRFQARVQACGGLYILGRTVEAVKTFMESYDEHA